MTITLDLHHSPIDDKTYILPTAKQVETLQNHHTHIMEQREKQGSEEARAILLEKAEIAKTSLDRIRHRRDTYLSHPQTQTVTFQAKPVTYDDFCKIEEAATTTDFKTGTATQNTRRMNQALMAHCFAPEVRQDMSVDVGMFVAGILLENLFPRPEELDFFAVS